MRISGHTDRADRELVSGWVLDLDDPLRRITLEIRAGDLSLGHCVADLFREDLLRSGIGDGHCAFKFKIPVTITAEQLKGIEFRILDPVAGSLAVSAGVTPRHVGYLAGNAGTVPFLASANGRYLLRNTGGNTGNLAFWYAVRRMFDNPVAFIEWHPNNLYCKDVIDKLVIPAANHLNPAWDLGPLAQLIERLGKEVIIFGLGSQAERESETVELLPGSVRYLKVLSEHARTLFVRGEFTAELCSRYGVKNVEPLGCPSILINPEPGLGCFISSRWRAPVERLYCAGAAFKADTCAVETALFAHVRANPGSMYVLQDQEELIDCATGVGRDGANREVPAKIAAILAPTLGAAELSGAFRRVARCFSSVRAWLEGAALHDHSVSTRIHGAIISLMAGVPTIVVAHDVRMRELCKLMAIPWLRQAEALEKLDSLERLFAEVEFDGPGFDSRRRVIARRYLEYLEAAGVTPSRVLHRMASGGAPHGQDPWSRRES
jgi:Polysaccharide pyruvyl transferase